MRKLLFILLAAVVLGGCSQVEDDEEEKVNIEEAPKAIDAIATIINNSGDNKEIMIFYCQSSTSSIDNGNLQNTITINPLKNQQVHIYWNTVKFSTNYNQKQTNEIWLKIFGDFVIDLSNGFNISGNVIKIASGSSITI